MFERRGIRVFCLILALGAMSPVSQGGEAKQAEDVVSVSSDAHGVWPTDHLAPQAVPLHAMIGAIARGDAKAFRAAFAPEVRQSIDEYGAAKAMEVWAKSLHKAFGSPDLEPGALAYEFHGDDERGRVSVSYQGGDSVAIAVRKTDRGWRISEK